MPFLAALLGAIMTGVMYWILIGNGREVINAWLDSKAEKDKQAKNTADAIRAREQEARAPLKSLTDPREAATALMAAVAEARGEMTPEQAKEIKAQMRTVLGLDADLDGLLAIGQHASRRATSPEVVADETLPLFRERLTGEEQGDLITMLRAVAAIHGGPNDRQARLIDKLESRLAADRRTGR